MAQFLNAASVFIGFTTSAIILVLAGAILLANRSEYRANHRMTKNPFRGVMNLGPEGARDPRLGAGLVFNRKTGLYESQHALSDEAVEAILFSDKT